MIKQSILFLTILQGLYLNSSIGGELERIRHIIPPPPIMESISIEDGLPQNSVRAVVQDSVGFIWFATEGGLTRYDGTEIKIFSKSSVNPSYPTIQINDVKRDKNGDIWVALEEGLVKYSVEQEDFVWPINSKSPSDFPFVEGDGIRNIFKAKDASLYFVSYEGALAHLDNNEKWHTFSELEGYQITALADADSNKIWVGTQEDGVGLFDTGSREVVFQEKLSIVTERGKITSLLFDDKKNLWIGTPQGLCLFQTTLDCSEENTLGNNELTNSDILSLFQDSKSRIWVGTRRGLNLLDGDNTQHFFSDPLYPSKSHFLSIYEDSSGLLWVGSLGGGAFYLDLSKEQFGLTSLGTTGFTASYLEQNGEIWAGTAQGGLLKLNKKRTQYEQIKLSEHSLEETWITSLNKWNENLLVGTLGAGLFILSPNENDYRKIENSELSLDAVWKIEKGVANDYWLATWGEGLVHMSIDEENTPVLTSIESEDLPQYLYDIEIDFTEKHIIWLGSAKNGLIKYNSSNGTILQLEKQRGELDSLSHNDVVALHASKLDCGLETYGGGLNYLAKGKSSFKHYEMEQTGGTIFGIAPGLKNTVWISTNGNGLILVDPDQDTYLHYGPKDGIQGMQFNLGSIHSKNDNSIIFGGNRGLNIFKPKNITNDIYSPIPVITEFQIYYEKHTLNKPIWQSPPLDLDNKQTPISFKFSMMNFKAPSLNSYEYMLEGSEKRWLKATHGTAQFSNLPGGDYTLLVKSKNRHGVPSSDTAKFSFHVNPPWYKSWWAYCAYAFFVSACIGLLLWTQKRKVIRLKDAFRLENAERELELTAAVQSGFLPQNNNLDTADYELQGFYRPAELCGGDWWWYEISETGNILLIVGDVTGHGAAPAMVTASVCTGFRMQGAQSSKPDILERLDTINEEVYRISKGEFKMAVSAFDFNPRNGKCDFITAGGLPALIFGRDGKVKSVGGPSSPLGNSDFQAFKKEVQLTPGDKLFLFTDGIVEVEMDNGSQYGTRRASKFLQQNVSLGCQILLNNLITTIDGIRGNQVQDDDWTAAMFEWKIMEDQARS